MKQYRTPLRYPGGKQRLAPFVRELLTANNLIGGHYVEPYAGGAGVAFELLMDNHVNHVHLNDSSYPIFAFWNSVLRHPDEMCRRIMDATLSVDEWKRRREIVRHPSAHDELEVGFSTLYLNRCNRSGVLTGGLIGGLDQTGEWKMDARFPRNKLVQRIEAIAARQNSITLRNLDAETFMREHVPTLPNNTLVYCDPPYFGPAGTLYLNWYKSDDHARVAAVIQQLPRRWVVSYDNVPEIRELYQERRSFVYYLQYNARRVYKGQEIFIFSDDLAIPFESSLSYVDEALQAWRAMTPQ